MKIIIKVEIVVLNNYFLRVTILNNKKTFY